ncbi:hypothetical protein [Roseomonas elaeocarpi]|uniref:Uncharacterized protein n=1 Tax=Roseomonas elaeocarpi TaxID=907779 RepID=A0ABV6JZW5_9PROT
MRVTPASSRARYPFANRRALSEDSRLSATILRMIALNSLSAFSQDVARTGSTTGVTPVRSRSIEAVGRSESPGRSLEAIPEQPSKPLPRGSLLDLKV